MSGVALIDSTIDSTLAFFERRKKECDDNEHRTKASLDHAMKTLDMALEAAKKAQRVYDAAIQARRDMNRHYWTVLAERSALQQASVWNGSLSGVTNTVTNTTTHPFDDDDIVARVHLADPPCFLDCDLAGSNRRPPAHKTGASYQLS